MCLDYNRLYQGLSYILGRDSHILVAQTRKKLQVCKHCLRTILEKIVDIFGSFYPLFATCLYYFSTIFVLYFKNIQCIGKTFNICHFYRVFRNDCKKFELITCARNQTLLGRYVILSIRLGHFDI